jgi:hypothetical protein
MIAIIGISRIHIHLLTTRAHPIGCLEIVQTNGATTTFALGLFVYQQQHFGIEFGVQRSLNFDSSRQDVFLVKM